MPERHAPGQPALQATACLHRQRCSPTERCPARTSPSSLRKVARPGLPRSPAAEYPRAVQPAVREHMPTCRTATYRPVSRPDSEHVAEYAGTSSPVVLLLLHDFPDPGKFPAFPCSSPSDTLNPHELPFVGMRDRHPGPASGRIGCFGLLLVPPFPGCCSGGWSAVAADGDRDGVAAASADGLRVRVVGDGDTVVPQLADQARDLSGGGDLHDAVVVLSLVPGEDDGQGGQVREDLVLADIGVPGPAGFGGVAALVWPGGSGRRACRSHVFRSVTALQLSVTQW